MSGLSRSSTMTGEKFNRLELSVTSTKNWNKRNKGWFVIINDRVSTSGVLKAAYKIDR